VLLVQNVEVVLSQLLVMLLLLELRHVELPLVCIDFLLSPYDEWLTGCSCQEGCRVREVSTFIIRVLTFDWAFTARSMTS